MSTYRLVLKACLVVLLFIVFGCGDENVTPPDTSDGEAPARATDLGIPSKTDSSVTLVWTAPGKKIGFCRSS